MIRDGIRRAFSLALRRRDRWERDVEDEIQFHLTLRAEQLLAEGRTPADAYAEAARRFGPLHDSRARLLKAAEHRERAMRRVELLDDLRQDLSFTLRTLKRQKGWTAVAVITSRARHRRGDGGVQRREPPAASSASLPRRRSRRLRRAARAHRRRRLGERRSVVDAAAVWCASGESTIDRSRVLEAYHSGVTMMKTLGDPSQLSGSWVSSSFASFAGPASAPRAQLLGRRAAHPRARRPPRRSRLWRGRFGADDHVIGRAITLDDSLYVVIGVMPASLRMPLSARGEPDVWLPLDADEQPHRRAATSPGSAPASRLPPPTRELDSLSARSERAAPPKRISPGSRSS